MMRLYMQDPYQKGEVYSDDGNFCDTVFFDFWSEDYEEWEKLADATLTEAGYARIGGWGEAGNYGSATAIEPLRY